MPEGWMRDSITALKSAIKKLERGDEGDFKQALIIADHATEIIMRNYLTFKEKLRAPYQYPKLLKAVCEKISIPSNVSEIIDIYHLIRDGFQHQNLEKIEKGLKGTTTGLTLEKSFLEEYLNAACKLFECLTEVKIGLGGNQNAKTD